MLLVIDVGNTNITLGVFDKEELFGTFRMKTKQPRTSDQCSDHCIRSTRCDAFTRQCDHQILRRKAGGRICWN